MSYLPSSEQRLALNVKSILSLFFALFVPPAGLILGILALKEIKQTQQEGRAFALTGLIVSAVWTAFIVLYLGFWVVLLGVLGFSGEMSTY